MSRDYNPAIYFLKRGYPSLLTYLDLYKTRHNSAWWKPMAWVQQGTGAGLPVLARGVFLRGTRTENRWEELRWLHDNRDIDPYVGHKKNFIRSFLNCSISSSLWTPESSILKEKEKRALISEHYQWSITTLGNVGMICYSDICMKFNDIKIYR